MKDKRRYPRFSVCLPVEYRSTNLSLEAHVLNMSQEGLFIGCSSGDKVGTPGRVKLSLPNMDQPLSLECRVVWSQKDHPHSGMGIMLTALDKELRLILANFLIARLYHT
jgi:uncharacterized protein (TIGR02266 family)